MHSIKTHISVFGGYFISAAPTTSGDSIWRKILDQKHNEYVWTSLSQFLFGVFFCLLAGLAFLWLVFWFWSFLVFWEFLFYFSGVFFVCLFWGERAFNVLGHGCYKTQTNKQHHKPQNNNPTIEQILKSLYPTSWLAWWQDYAYKTGSWSSTEHCILSCLYKKIHHFLSYSKQAFKWAPKTNKIQALAYK